MKATLLVLTFAVASICISWITPVSTPASNEEQNGIKKAAPPAWAFFRVHRQGRDGATATWGLVSNNGVSGFVLQKTYEDPYDEYAEWSDVCAMPSGNGRSFKHHDSPCTPGFISYRVVAMNGSTPVGVSAIETIQIVQH